MKFSPNAIRENDAMHVLSALNRDSIFAMGATSDDPFSQFKSAQREGWSSFAQRNPTLAPASSANMAP